MQTLSRGQKARLDALTPATTVDVGLALAAPGGIVFDLSCFGVDAAGRLSDDRYFIFYNQPQSPAGEIRTLGAQGGDAEVFRVDLAAIPASIQKLVFVATIDGDGTMAQLSSGHLRLVAQGSEVGRFDFRGADFGGEKAIIVAEIYRRDGWRVGAVGQGFAGGLSALLAHFGGAEAESATPAPAPAPAAPPPAPPVNAARLSLDKKIEAQAPQLLSLVKKAQITLEKRGLGTHRAKVALCLDISGSMSALYASGQVQKLAERVLALGTRFDDNGAIDVFLFGVHAHEAGEMSVDNFTTFLNRIGARGGYQLEYGTNYGKAMAAIRRHYYPNARSGDVTSDSEPVYVMFITDGQTDNEHEARRQIVDASRQPIFWQFMGIGKSSKGVGARRTFFGGGSDFAFLESLDTMDGRHIDNANFFSVEDPSTIGDEALYELLMAEYPEWVKAAPAKGLLTR